jgi:hypothetical protein
VAFDLAELQSAELPIMRLRWRSKVPRRLTYGQMDDDRVHDTPATHAPA